MEIKIIQCPKCGQIQGSMSLKVFQCKFCSHKAQLRNVKILKKTDDSGKAQEIISNLKMQKAMKNQAN
ncbi:MAG: hypothetical protein V1672_05730 [Candidatus Diapherotrites archaeon]